MEKLFYLFDQIQELEPDLKRYLRSILKRTSAKRKEIIQKPGQIPTRIYFIEKGLVRNYWEIRKKEKTSWLVKENDLLASVDGFFTQRPATEYIQALEDCEFYSITYQQLQYIYSQYPQFNYHGRILTTQYYQLSHEIEYMQLQQGRDKVKYLIEKHPELFKRVPDKYLASFLGLAPETYSTLKSDYHEAQARLKKS